MKAHCRKGILTGSALLVAVSVILSGQTADPISELLTKSQLNLATDGRAFLVHEASRASFFLIGGLHGDNETMALVKDLGKALEPLGYRHTAAEMSPWAANRLLGSAAAQNEAPLWGCDIEEIQPHRMIGELASANPRHEVLQTMAEMTKAGYRRSQAPELLRLAQQVGDFKDIAVQGTSLRTLMLRTLEIEAKRRDPASALAASVDREAFMKELFVANYRRASRRVTKPRIMAVFGQNHLHRGYDRRGVSTLGNFIAELAVAEGVQSFHLVLFAAGGKVSLGGLRDADQTKDHPAFAFLASISRFPATVFDLRPARALLRRGTTTDLSSRDASLRYWADSYDAIICYREVTPVGQPLGR